MDTSTQPEHKPLQIATFDSRFLAKLLDFLIFSPIFFIEYLLPPEKKESLLADRILLFLALLILQIVIVRLFSATPGKLLMKIKIVKSGGEAVGWKEAILREFVDLMLRALNLAIFVSIYDKINFVYYSELSYLKAGQYLKSLSILFKYTSYLSSIWFTGDVAYYVMKGRVKALHDYIAGTLVVRSKPYKNMDSYLKFR